MNSPVQEIKERLDIVEFIKGYVPLSPAGKNFKAPCPFHKEKTPSFMVSPERQTWHCFGSCAEGGDIFKFIMKYENLEFYEALKVLAEKAGIELKRLSPQDQKQFGVLYDINDVAKNYFKEQLKDSPEILKYIEERGLKKEIADEFELGFASPNFDKLAVHLINLGFDVRDIERAGLVFKSERGGYIDRFRGRLMFPIYNTFGKVVAFSGRILPQYERGTEGKYINSPETPIFVKSRIFYGLHKTKNEIKEKNSAVLVEGQMDFLMMYQDGVKNVVASSGTALTQDHLQILRRFTDEIILSFDNDEAGQKAAERSIDLAGANDLSVKLLILKDYKDPAEAVEKRPGHIAELLENTIHGMEFYFSRYLEEGKKDIRLMKQGLKVILGKIKNLASPVERSFWLKQLSDRTNIDDKTLLEEMVRISDKTQEVRSKDSERIAEDLGPHGRTRKELIAERLLSLIIINNGLQAKINEYSKYLPEDYLMLLENLRSEKPSASRQIDERLKNLLNIITLRSSFELERLGDDKIEEEFDNLLKQVHFEHLKEDRQRLLVAIREMEKRGDETELHKLLEEFKNVSQVISEMGF